MKSTSFEFSDPQWLGGSFDAVIDNSALPPIGEDPSDVDFYTFRGLRPGQPFIAEVTSANFDTLLGWFDDTGTLAAFTDEGFFSRLRGVATAAGEAHIAITGAGDTQFLGVHSRSGEYAIQVTPIPEPTAIALACTTIAVCCGIQRYWKRLPGNGMAAKCQYSQSR